MEMVKLFRRKKLVFKKKCLLDKQFFNGIFLPAEVSRRIKDHGWQGFCLYHILYQCRIQQSHYSGYSFISIKMLLCREVGCTSWARLAQCYNDAAFSIRTGSYPCAYSSTLCKAHMHKCMCVIFNVYR